MAVGDDEVVGGAGEGDAAAVVQPVVERADEDEVVEFGGAAVFPVPQVMGVQAAGGPTAGDHAAAIAVFQGAAQPAVDGAGGPPGADDPAVALEPHLTGGVTQQQAAFGVGEQRSQVQRRDLVFDVEVGDDGGALPVRAAGGFGVPAGVDQVDERVHGGGHRRCLLGVGGVVAFPVGDQRLAAGIQRGVDSGRF
ncbi:Uncharacterised protein [Mycolicibacterium vanbaalenii]|uniref:Uncharacterized protein n=1 Tax=Mycolicibacterium vanbaalenii TaxID=110539 RepID=A0A5S9RAN8_MYCVN|nr:Uncharacterised protein [Mycolicibacterium vanbaalenii]